MGLVWFVGRECIGTVSDGVACRFGLAWCVMIQDGQICRFGLA